jgi:hypothetical protein
MFKTILFKIITTITQSCKNWSPNSNSQGRIWGSRHPAPPPNVFNILQCEVVDHVETVLSEVEDMRTNINENFKEIFNKSEQLEDIVNSTYISLIIYISNNIVYS